MRPITKLRIYLQLHLIRLLAFMGLRPGEIHYIGSSETLPAPLSPEEERELLSRLPEDGPAVRGTLIEHNLRLVVYIARKFDNTGVGIEDLVSIGTIGLIKAVNTFDPTKNIKLATYASRCIENEILMFLSQQQDPGGDSIDEPLNSDWDGNELLLSDVLGCDGNISKAIEEEVDRQLLSNALSKLTAREQTIMELRFGLNQQKEKTQKEVADLLGISQSYISRLEKKILNKLQREIRRME